MTAKATEKIATIPYPHPHLSDTNDQSTQRCVWSALHVVILFWAANRQSAEKIWIPCLRRRCNERIRHGVVGIVSSLSAGRSGGSNPGEGTRFFCSTYRPDRVWGPPNSLFKEHRVSFQDRKWPGCDIEHSLPSSAEVKIENSCTSVPSIRLHGVDGDFSFLVTTSRLKVSIQPSYKTKAFSRVGRVEFQEDISPLL